MIEIKCYRHLLCLLGENIIINVQLCAGSTRNLRLVVLGGTKTHKEQEHVYFPLLIRETMPHATPEENLTNVYVPLFPLFLFMPD